MRRVPFALLVGALLGGASPALAAGVSAPLAPSGVVAAGEEVRTPIPVLPARVHEFELFLVPEGGPPVRLSAGQRAGTREVRWRVPAIPARRARLVLRVGDERSESDSPPSEWFELAPLSGSELGELLGGRSEAGWRIERPAGPAGNFAPGPGDAGFFAAGTLAYAVPAPGDADLVAPPSESGPAGFADDRASRPTSAIPRACPPAFTPLRI